MNIKKMNRKLKLNKNAQIFSIDFTFAIISFIIVIIISIYLWNVVTENINLKEQRVDLIRINHYIASSLLETSGNPANWSLIDENQFNSSISNLGLTRSHSFNNLDSINKNKASAIFNSGNYLIDENKLIRLIELNNTQYDFIKETLGITGPSYHFHIDFKLWNNTGYQSTYQIGKSPNKYAIQIIRSDRFASLNNTWTHVIIKTWKECLVEPCY